MKCPKCGYASHAYADQCKKCGRDLSKYKKDFSYITTKPGIIDISLPLEKIEEQSSGTLAGKEVGTKEEPAHKSEEEKITPSEEKVPTATAEAEDVSIEEIEFDITKTEETKAEKVSQEKAPEGVGEGPQPQPAAASEVAGEIEFNLSDLDKGKLGDLEAGQKAAMPEVEAPSEAGVELKAEDIDLGIVEGEEAEPKAGPPADRPELVDISLDDLSSEEQSETGEAEDQKKGEKKIEEIEQIDFELEEEDRGDKGKKADS